MASVETRASWLPLSWGARFTIAVTGSLIAWWSRSRWIPGNYLPRNSAGTMLAVVLVILCWIVSISFPFWAFALYVDRMSRASKKGRVLLQVVLLFAFVWITKDWFGAMHTRSLPWILLAAVLIYPLPVMGMKRKAIRLALLGDYDGALRINRVWLPSAVYGAPFQGWIMLQAGRFREALELLKHSAFDEKGRPVLTNPALCNYAVTLMYEERYAEAQSLLEAAVRVPQELEDYLQFSLAKCLLLQKKEAGRASQLVEQAVASRRKKKTQSAEDRTFLAECMAVDAWALASSGRGGEAEATLTKAFADSDSLSKDDLAGLLLLRGKTLLALDNSEMAQAAFEKALAIFPYGYIAASARGELAKIEQ